MIVTLMVSGAAAWGTRHSARASDPDSAPKRERCATRLSMAILGKTAEASLLAAADPQNGPGGVDAMLANPAFFDRFASFINAEINTGPSASAADDPVYFLARGILEGKKPWRDLFVGPYDVAATADGKALTIVADSNGLGYFRTAPWMVRYAGNEVEGIRISAAYHMIHDTTGFQVPAVVAKPGEDRSAEGRQADACKGCHYEPWFALDKAASVLSRKKTTDDGKVSFDGAAVKAVTLLGKTLKDDKDLVRTLVDSDAFKFNQCRRVFTFLYGRAENQCESLVFDACVKALEERGTIQAALAVVAKDPGFCQ
jgi:hypothetical protein